MSPFCPFYAHHKGDDRLCPAVFLGHFPVCSGHWEITSAGVSCHNRAPFVGTQLPISAVPLQQDSPSRVSVIATCA